MDEQSRNAMRIWSQVDTTDPEYTKRVTIGAWSFTNVDAYYQIQRATEVFGPYGQGWCCSGTWEVHMEPKPHTMFVGVLWYIDPESGSRCEFPIADSFPLTKGGSGKLDSDAYKKVLTGALTKGLSYLGFNADVFLGRFDDSKYVEEQRAAHAPKPEPLSEEGCRVRDEMQAVESHEELDRVTATIPDRDLSESDKEALRAVYHNVKGELF